MVEMNGATPSAVELIRSPDLHRMLTEWNDTSRGVPSATVPELFAAQAARVPDAVAVVSGQAQLTYAELDARSDRLAQALTDRGVGPESFVAVVMERSVELVVTLLGIVKAGGAYVPVDPEYPAERMTAMIADCDPVLVLCGPGLERPGWLVADDVPAVGGGSRPLPEAAVLPGHPVYVVYTSGSTGVPKGVVVPHAAVDRLVHMAPYAGIHGDDVVAQLASVSFDAATFEVWGALLNGATLAIAPVGPLSVPALGEFLRAHRVSVLWLTAGLFHQVVDADVEVLSGVRRLLAGGDVLSPVRCRTVLDRLTATELVNGYGPTENTTFTTTHVVTGAATAVPIGRPIADTRVYVLDSRLQPVAVGVTGELYASGAGLARGYLGQPTMTSERFVANPFEDGERMYRTGDLVRWNSDGVLEFVGRADDQVKVRGFRVEPGEIEAAVLSHEQVTQAAVVVREDVPGRQHLVAYVVPEDSDTRALREYLRGRLPEYMVPAAVVALDTLPLTANGKLDRKALPAPHYGSVSGSGPRTVREEILCTAFAEVLNLPQVGVDENFFDLGGDSLLAVALMERLRSRDVAVDIRTLFAEPTAARLAEAAGRGEVEVPPCLIPSDAERITAEMVPLAGLTTEELDRAVEHVPGGAANVADVYPLAPLQEGMFFHHRLDADQGRDTYIVRELFRFDTRAALDSFLAAWQQVIDRHDILRTALAWDGLPHPVQVVHRRATMPVVEATADGADVVGHLLTVSDGQMDLRRAPLMDAFVAPDGDQWILVLRLHHVTQDHTTLEVILHEVLSIMRGRAHELPDPLPYRAFVAQALLGVPAGEHEAYFTGLLGEVTEPTAPFGVLEVRSDGSDVAELALKLDADLAARARSVARRSGVSPATVFHVVWARVLGALSGRADVVFGTVLFGRMQAGAGADRVPGLFINTLPVRARTHGVTVLDSLHTMRDQLAELIVHEHAPLATAQHASGVQQPHPLFTAVLNYRHETEAADTSPEGFVRLFERERTNYPLILSVDDFGTGFGLTVQAVESMDIDLVGTLLTTTTANVVAALERSPQDGLDRIDVLPESDLHRMLVQWNDTFHEVPPATMPQLFAVQVARTPDAVAVVGEAEELTYAELDARSNRLARHLVKLGVGPELIAAVALPRSVNWLVAVLAVMKAGGAYLPVDPQYPADRIAYMLDDAQPVCVLTDAATAAVLPGTADPLVLDDIPLETGDPGELTDAERIAPLSLGSPAYVIYTSGSTGRPKGVVVTHAGIASLSACQTEHLGVTADSRVLQFASPSFDVATWDVCMALLSGARLVMAPAHELLSGDGLAGVLHRHGVTHATLPPAVLPALPENALPDSMVLVVAGEALPSSAVEQWSTGRLMINAYGPTESTVIATMSGPLSGSVTPPIGTPVENTRAYVLDSALRPVPAGVAGELYLAGAGLARGYLGRPGLTAERFVADPFGEGERMYRTGDLARWTPAGAIEFLGRTDGQVKIRGFRIEPGEIEAVVTARQDVRQAAVLVREDSPGDRRLVAYVVPADAAGADAGLPQRLRDHLRTLLPEYMVPAAVLVLDALPLTVNGKLDRNALPAPEYGTLSRTGRGPRTVHEEILCQVFAAVLGVPHVGVDDNFFDLGGHSLFAVRLVSRIRTVLGVEVSIRSVFDAPTVAQIAERISEAGSARNGVVAAPRPERVPLSFAQQRLWFLGQLEGPNATYNIPVAVHLAGELDTTALQAALNDVVARHEVLRTVYPSADGSAWQQVLDAVTIDLPVVRADPADLAQEVDRAAAHIFDLAAQPPIRATLLRTEPDRHVLVLVLHHIAGDGWSLEPLWRDLSTAYSARLTGRPPAWDALPVQYADYALWQRAVLGEEVFAEQVEHWRTALAGAPVELALPTDRPRPVLASHHGGLAGLRIPADTHSRLAQLARNQGVTMFMVLQAAVAIVLNRLGAGTDIPIGSPTAGRTDEALDGLVGFFVNTLVLRTDLSGDPSFNELLDRVRDTGLGAFENQDVPFERLVEELAPARSTARHPLFQVSLALQNNRTTTLELPGLHTSQHHAGRPVAKFDLDFQFTEQFAPDGTPTGLNGEIVFAIDLFDGVTVEGLGRRLLRVLEGVTADPGRPVGGLEILGESERRRMLVEWNDTARAVPATTLSELFAAQVARAPGDVAVVHGAVELSYAELDARANGLARELVAQGVGPDVLVAVLMERSADLVVALLAVLKAGGAYLPLDLRAPVERLRVLVAESGAGVLVTDAAKAGDRLVGEVRAAGGRVLVVDGAVPGDPSPLPVRSLPDHLAYVMYTSGSTGTPKAIAITQHDVVQLATDECWRHDERLCVLFRAPHSFDASVYELWVPLLSGGKTVIASDTHLDSAALRELVAEQELTHLHLTAGLFRVIAEEDPAAFAGLREVSTGGDVVPALAARRVLESVPGIVVRNTYGPTEMTLCSVQIPLREPAEAGRVLPIGRPMDNTRAYVLDGGLRPVPAGVAGELYLAGAGLARGYLGRAGLTAERFVADPFGEGERMYRTGDVVRWTAQGVLEFVGRADDQVKIRGFRVEPGEVEAVLGEHGAVAEAAVVVREDVPGDKRLVAYVVPAGTGSVSGEALREYLRERLPEYMVPAAVVLLEGLPITANAKLDRKALPVPDYGPAPGTGRGPRTVREEILCAAFADVLGVPSVGVEDSFFDLGGHSLLAVKLVSRIRAVLGVEVPIRAVFDAPTVAGVAGRLPGAGAARAELVAGERPERVPLSFAQQRLWFLGQLEGPSTTYNIPVSVRLEGELDVQALRAALGDVVARHEVLRTVYPSSDGTAWQQVLDPGPGTEFTVTAVEPSEVDRAMESAAGRVFDLATETPLRVTLLRVSATEHVLVVVLHHIAGDGWSMGPLWRDLSAAYAARGAGRVPTWEPLPVQYADYAVWQREVLAGESFAGQVEYWRSALAGMPEELTLPADRPRPSVSSHRGGLVEVAVPARVHADLSRLAREQGMTLFMVMQAAVAVLLSRLGSGSDIAIGSPVAGRTDEALEGLVGFFVNTLVLRTDVSGDPTFTELLGRVRECGLGAFEHQDVPFERLVEELAPVRSTARHPLFQVSLSIQNTQDAPVAFPGLTAHEMPLTLPVAKFDLEFDFTEQFAPDGTPTGLNGEIVFAIDLFDGVTVEGLGRRLLRVLEGVTADPGRPVGGLEILGESERRRMLVEWNDTARAVPATTLSELFAAQVARAPGDVAVVHGAVELSYAELDARANGLARELVAQGVGPDVLVAVLMERSADLVVALLAVLKAGGAYLPLDLRAPVERLRVLVAESGAGVLVTDAAKAGDRLVGEVRAAGGRVLVVDGAVPGDPSPLPVRSLPDHLAYVMYTSGSTGTPKAIAISQQNVVDLIEDRCWHHDGTMRLLLRSPHSFDSSTYELWAPLLHGGVLAISPQGHLDAAGLRELIHRHRLTHVHVTAGLFRVIAEEDPAGFSTVVEVNTGGDVVPALAARRVLESVPGIVVRNLYGPTEMTLCSVQIPLREPAEAGRVLPIGRPMDNTRAYVLDGGLRPVPAGVAGELYLAGAGLARGYLGRAGLTAERFVADPFGEGERMYRTGDVVRWTAQGVLEFVGRADDQVKIRGFRVEPGEVEAVLGEHGAVAEAAVVVREDVPGDKRLVAYVVPAGTGPVPGEALREYLRERLPEYMVPAAVVLLEGLPITANAKLDRKALPVPDYGPAPGTGRGPRTVREEILCAAFADVLGVPSVGVEDSFFDLGGHSLLAVKLVERLRARGVSVDVRTLFAEPTVARLAAAAGQDEVEVPPCLIPAGASSITAEMVPLAGLTTEELARAVAHVPGGAADVADVYPLAPLQEGMFFHHQLHAGDGQDPYVMRQVFRFDSRARLEAFLTAWQQVIDRHDILRTSLAWEGLPHPVQVVHRAATLPLTEADTAESLFAAAGPMDLHRAPLIDAYAAPDTDGRWALLLRMHHVTQDHTTLEVVLGEIRDILDGNADRLPRPLPYRDFVAQTLLGVAQEEHDAYFARTLGDVTEPTAPYGVLEVRGDGSTVTERTGALETGLAARLRTQAHRLGVSPATLFHVVWSRVLSVLAGRDDVVFGTVLFGRMQAGAGADRVPGLFINTLPVRTRTRGVTVQEAVRAMRAQLADLMVHEHASLASAQRASGVAAPAPLFTALLNYRHSGGDQPEAGIDGVELVSGQGHTNYPLLLAVDDFGTGFGFVVKAAAPIDTESLLAVLTETTERVVTALEADRDSALDRIEVLSAGERHRLLAEWNGTDHDVPPATLPQLFAGQVARSADSIAVISADTALTYSELDARSNRLARLLIDGGVGPETLVAVLMERSADLVVTLLAVLKAGGAYVPIDPQYPAERIKETLADCDPLLVVTRGAAVEDRPTIVLDTPDCVSRLSAYDDGAVADADRNAPLHPHHPAYVIYTSGSTGRAKGVVVEHRSVATYLAKESADYGGAGTRSLFHASVSFDATVTGLYVPLVSGGTVRLATLDECAETGPRPTFMKVTPSHLTMLQALADEASPSGQLIVGGEALTGEVLGPWRERHPDTVVINAYGPTETTVNCLDFRMEPDFPTPRGAVPIGRPYWNTRVYVLDNGLQPVPTGVAGELYVAGDHLARGYLGRPELTAVRFVANPFGDCERLYRTGDVVRWTADGVLEYLGRADDQVKIRGYRIEPAEIEAVLTQHEQVGRATVIVREDTPGDKRLVAYVTPAGTEADAAGVRAAAAARLPAHMVPAAVVVLGELPLTVNGKLDRRALPLPEYAVTDRQPRSETEKALCALFAEVLGVPSVGLDDGFFALGGHSLLAVRLMNLVNDRLGTSLPLRTVLIRDTVAALAAALDGETATETVRISQDVRLDPEITPGNCGPCQADPHRPGSVLLTGATGFLGAFILREVLDRTDATVYCLVRASDREQGAERLRRIMDGYGLWEQRLADRIVPVAGDLDKPRLGLTEPEFDLLAEQVQVICHNGARVNFSEHYTQLRSANVHAVTEILRLATRHHLKPVHYVSTMSTLIAGPDDPDTLPENWVSDPELLSFSGYAQSKWVAEGIMRLAQERGVPTTVHRPSHICGHSVTGVAGSDDALWHYVRACVELGARPVMETYEASNLVPVDFVAQAFTHLAFNRPADGTAYNLAAPSATLLDDLLDHAQSLGYQMDVLPYASWQQRLSEKAQNTPVSPDTSVHAVVLLHEAETPDTGRYPRVPDRRNLQRGLADAATVSAVVGPEQLDRYFAHFVESGFLPRPAEDDASTAGPAGS
ncbi:amino acid adenylation domain-containing protein [Streptomyces sp. NBC_01728]|uniref:non-ribosomal peptide synthetase n=1 Tax=unclassified Streptomyces TaxID=2593676 RepID=UPI00224E557D|nr:MULTISPECIES: non-ribosomal peptide synthetase [unclassified Streptomyces]MCX4460730.1 amino acid adenylation domain-containing protein [Streptomyces sp. NBC_01719]MCX4499940.1 amino acid adenylation domain-containing protein [Streptomyces sp. NBC_01728]